MSGPGCARRVQRDGARGRGEDEVKAVASPPYRSELVGPVGPVNRLSTMSTVGTAGEIQDGRAVDQAIVERGGRG